MKLLKIILIIIVTSLIGACNNSDNSTNNPFKGMQGVMATQKVNIARPLSIAFLDDESGSRGKFNIPKLRLEDLEPAIEYVKNNGGAVLIGVVASNSDKTTVQFQVDPDGSPARPARPVSANYTNRFEFHDAKENYKKVMLPQYRKDSTQYAKSLLSRIKEFKARAKDLMNSEHNPEATDIGSAINRAIYFHRLGPSNAKRATVLISDGLDTQGSKIKSQQNLDIDYYLAYGSTEPLGSWANKCKPVITPDLDFALTEILN